MVKIIKNLFGELPTLKLPFVLNFSFLYPYIISFLAISFFVILTFIALKLLKIYLNLKKEYAILEVKPLSKTEQTAFATSQLFNLIHNLTTQKSYFERLINFSKTYSFEIVSTRTDGIRYLIRVYKEDVDLLKKTLLSYLPGISINETTDYLTDSLNPEKFRIREFKLNNHFAFPLKKQEILDEYDPIAYITGNMTKLMDNELISFQIITSPINKRNLRGYRKIKNMISQNKDLVNGLRQMHHQLSVTGVLTFTIKSILFVFIYLLMLPVGIFIFLMSRGEQGPLPSLPFSNTSKKNNNPYQKELEDIVKNKLDQQLFTTSIRFFVLCQNAKDARQKQKGFVSSLSNFTNSEYQSLRPKKFLILKLFRKLKTFQFTNRLLSFFANPILSSSEVGDIYHFPFTSTTKTENIVKLHSKQLPAPVSLKRASDFNITFAQNSYGGSTTKIGLSEEERRRHMYIIGATGTGKSTMLLSMINQDMQNGKGLCVIDPHGDLIEKVLPLIPKNRIKDVIYFNLDDISYPVGVNLLELSKGLNEEDALREKEFITESIISLFHKIYSDKYSGPRMEYILRNTIHTAFTVENATLFTVYKL
ncbi:MAG: type IV secretion system DNA-binding domain-containing protein, partial [Actinobacteria bacterium]|nr:type IV secretion system DNA-binding domain-containing protein [Actinomycetota bacterium]